MNKEEELNIYKKSKNFLRNNWWLFLFVQTIFIGLTYHDKYILNQQYYECVKENISMGKSVVFLDNTGAPTEVEKQFFSFEDPEFRPFIVNNMIKPYLIEGSAQLLNNYNIDPKKIDIDTISKTSTFMNFANIYMDLENKLGKDELSKKNYDSGIKYFNDRIKIIKRLMYPEVIKTIPNSYDFIEYEIEKGILTFTVSMKVYVNYYLDEIEDWREFTSTINIRMSLMHDKEMKKLSNTLGIRVIELNVDALEKRRQL